MTCNGKRKEKKATPHIAANDFKLISRVNIDHLIITAHIPRMVDL